MFSKKIPLLILVTLAVNCQAAGEKPSGVWYSIKTFEFDKMVVDGKFRIDSPGKFLKDSCVKSDLVSKIEFAQRLRDGIRDEQITVDILDGENGADGKISNVTITIKNSFREWDNNNFRRYYFKWSEEKFFREYSNCMKERNIFELWLKSQNDIYRKNNSKYE